MFAATNGAASAPGVLGGVVGDQVIEREVVDADRLHSSELTQRGAAEAEAVDADGRHRCRNDLRDVRR